MNKQDIIFYIKDQLSIEADKDIIPQLIIKNLQIASLKFIYFVVQIEDKFGFEFEETEMGNLNNLTINELASLIYSKL